MIDTTNAALNSAMDVLLGRAEQLDGARKAATIGDDQLVMRYINEALRFSPPVPLLARLSTAEHSFQTGTQHQTTVPAGKLVYVAIGSAMMDQRVLPNPTEFRLDRPDHHYLHLGWGMHRCFGKYIAQTMLVEMMKALLQKNNLRRGEGAAGHPSFEGPFLASFTVEYDA
jgi:cytochrome P450